MIQTTIPEIDVQELMQRVKAEAATMRSAAARLPIAPGTTMTLTMPPPPLVHASTPLEFHKHRLDEMLRAARDKTDVGSQIPKFLRWLFRKQGPVNRTLIEVLKSLVNTDTKLNKRVNELTAALQAQNDWLATLPRMTAQLHEQLSQQLAEDRQRLKETIDRMDERHVADAAFLKAELAQQNAFLFRKPGPSEQPTEAAGSNVSSNGRLDAFYLAFENRFRGPREEIQKRLVPYVEVVRGVEAGTADRPIVDIGCGRGEWLELLYGQQLVARGVDLNSTMVALCTGRGLEATQADALAYLREQADASLGAITGFHIIEHLPLETLLDLFTECYRVLLPGGIAVFESPNCKNLVVGACNFYSDPTHQRPLFPDTAAFMLETRGFAKVEIRYLSPVDGNAFRGEEPEARLLKNWFYGPRDFAVVAHKSLRV